MKFVPSINKMSQMKILLVNVLHTTLNEDNLPAVRATSPELCATQVAKIPRRCILLLYDAVFVSQQSDLTRLDAMARIFHPVSFFDFRL